MTKTIEELSDAIGATIQNDPNAPLQSLTGVTYRVQAVETVQKAIYGEPPLGNRRRP